MNENYTILSIDIGKKNLGYSVYNGNELNFGIFDITYHIKKFKLNENIEGRNTVLIKWLNNMTRKYNINKIRNIKFQFFHKYWKQRHYQKH